MNADIYFIQEESKDGKGKVKIGRVTSRIEERRIELQTGNPNKLNIIFYLHI